MASSVLLYFVLGHVLPGVFSGHLLALPGTECFERVAVGRRLNSSDVSRTLTTRTVRQCEQECDRDDCNSFSFGISSRGNATCELSLQLADTMGIEDTDFDLFLKRTECRNKTADSVDNGYWDNACFRRMVTGRRLSERYVRRSLFCDSLRHCEETCAQEVTFHCEGFNFRFDPSGQGRSTCQLTSVPSSHLDVTLDFNSDRDYDFFERDRNAPKSCSRPWSGYRPWTEYGVGVASGGWQQRFDNSPRDWGVGGSYWGDGYGGGGGGYSLYHAGQTPSDECFVRTKAGFRLDRAVVILSLSAASLYHCESECANERKFACNIFSYRYSLSPSLPGDNCHLGERLYRNLDPYIDFIPDREYDIYARNEFGRPGCIPKRFYESECFERVRSGLRLIDSMTRLAVHADSLKDCERECLSTNFFTCRAFSYRYGPPTIGDTSENCQLTDWPISELNPMKHFVDDPGRELYHRGSYGHGCELDHWPYGPPYYPETAYHSSTAVGHARPTYLPPTYYPPSKSPPYFPPSSYGPPIKEPQPTYYPPPSSYGPPIGNSIHSPFIPPPKSTYFASSGYGYVSSSHTYLPPSAYGGSSSLQKPLDHICYVAYGVPARLLPSAIHVSLLVPDEETCKAECTRARQQSHFRCATFSYKGSNCELSAIEERDLRHGVDFVHNTDYWLFSWDFTDARCYIPPSGYHPTPSDPIRGVSDGTWRTFTVSGRPCKTGTYCTQNLEVGIWSCPVDNGDWDYCCRSGHHCGYSEGYNYPWCYVGSAAKDQWRPCSDHYYPYHNIDRPLHWPVAYLHREGPPNITTEHHPSLVDNFLESLRQENARKMNYQSEQASNSSLPDLQVVDVEPRKDVEETSAMNKLWTWGLSKYNTSSSKPPEGNSSSHSTLRK